MSSVSREPLKKAYAALRGKAAGHVEAALPGSAGWCSATPAEHPPGPLTYGAQVPQ